MARERTYRLGPDGRHELVIRWRGIWKNVEVLYDGKLRGEPFENLAELKQGRAFKLPGKKKLWVQFKKGFGQAALEVTIDGRPVPGSDTDPRNQVKQAAILLYVVAGLSSTVGALGLAGVEFLEKAGIGWPSLASGAVLAVLGYLTQRFRSRLAIGAAILLVAADTLLSLVVLVQSAFRGGSYGIVMRVFILMALVKGFQAVAAARRVDEDEKALEAFR